MMLSNNNLHCNSNSRKKRKILLYLYKFNYSVVWSCFLFFFASVVSIATASTGRICNTTTTGICPNPLQQGCLINQLSGWKKSRVCNSDDPPEAVEFGLCRESQFNYLEIRLGTQPFEIAVLLAWVLQIVLSEILDVPTTLETGSPDVNLNFYDPIDNFDFENIFVDDVASLQRSFEVGDCRKARNRGGNNDNYQVCHHAIPEAWYTSQWAQELIQTDVVEPPNGLGVTGQETWFITKFSVERDPSVATYMGLAGEQNRKKLADLFLRPTTWKTYCDVVSTDNCITNDGVAARAPQTTDEETRMFVDGLYTGHFRKTAENDCDTFPTSCTGHIADYPCGWYSYVEPITYHLNISLESNGDEPGAKGYTYNQLVELWAAANATKSNLIMQWWKPDSLPQSYFGTDAEFIPILLPPISKECVQHRRPETDRCSNDKLVRVGDPKGACGQDAVPLDILISGRLYDLTVEGGGGGGTTTASKQPPGRKSPAYEAIHRFSFSEIDLNGVFELYFQYESPREGLCQWAVDNIEVLQRLIPRTYPRVLQNETESIIALVTEKFLGSVALLLVIWSTWTIFRNRTKRVIRTAQIEFLFMLLLGAALVALAAIINGFSCMTVWWLFVLGYTLMLVPLVVKIAAINRLMKEARRMRRVSLQRKHLLQGVAIIIFVAVVFLLCWSILDPAKPTVEYELTNQTTELGETIVKQHVFCKSSSPVWVILALGWQFTILLAATVLAVQTRTVRQEFNESQVLAVLIYSHAVFLALGVVVYLLSSSGIRGTILMRARGIVFSLDTILSICIYFLPKFAKLKSRDNYAQNDVQQWFAQFADCAFNDFSNESMHQASSSPQLYRRSGTKRVRNAQGSGEISNLPAVPGDEETMARGENTTKKETTSTENEKSEIIDVASLGPSVREEGGRARSPQQQQQKRSEFDRNDYDSHDDDNDEDEDDDDEESFAGTGKMVEGLSCGGDGTSKEYVQLRRSSSARNVTTENASHAEEPIRSTRRLSH